MKVQLLWVRAGYGRKALSAPGLFDTGSEEGLVRESLARRFRCMVLPDPVPVLGIGGGKSWAKRSAFFQLRVLGKWCRYAALVVPDSAVDVDLLVGEDFLLRYGLSIEARRNRLRIAYPEHFKRMTRRGLFVASPRGRGR